MEKSSFYADGDVLFHSVLVIDTLHHHHLLSMFFVLIVEAPPPNEVSLIELSFPHSFIVSFLASPKMLTLGIVQTSMSFALAQPHLSSLLIRNNSQHYTFSSNFVSYYSWCSIRVSTKPILRLPICSPTAIEVSHPYRCRCLTHTCVCISPIHPTRSHS